MNLHYSLFRVCDAAGVTHILSLAEIRGIEFCYDHNHCQVRLGGTFPIDLNPHDGDRLLDAWNKYQRIYHAAKMAPWIDKFALSHGAKACLRIDDYFAAVAEDFSTTIGDESYLEAAKII